MASGMAAVSAQTVAVNTDAGVNARVADALLAKRVSVTLDHVPVRQAIDAVMASAGVYAAYQDVEMRTVDKSVTLRAKNGTLGATLDEILAGTSLQAQVIGTNVIRIAVDRRDVTAGAISGRVIHTTTKQPLRGATAVLDDTTRGVTSREDGSFHFSNISPGTHRVSVRLLGYQKTRQTVDVADGQTAAVEVALTPSANQLDQVVVTGTVIPTERKAVANAITVITAQELERRGITHIDQLFRGDVPGVFVKNLGANNPLGGVVMYSRGATSVSFRDNGDGKLSSQSNSIKTYVDGVELANPLYLSQIDPRSIERIEILTGPQASTIYGSNALNGVMQIFTKRGKTSRPQITASLLSGTLENNFNSSFAPQHDYSAQVTGMEGRLSYNAGSSWNYMGHWSPAIQQSVLSGFGGVRFQGGPMTVDGSVRLSQTQNKQRGDGAQQFTTRNQTGHSFQGTANGITPPRTATLAGRTLGFNVGYAPTSWWTHELVLGQDASEREERQTAPANIAPSDTGLVLAQIVNSRTSARYSTTARVPVTSWGQLTTTAGVDGWKSLKTSMELHPSALSGTLNDVCRILYNANCTTLTRQPEHNTGAFLQGQLGIADALFFTYGIRAEWNPNYGRSEVPNYAPKYGMAYTRDLETSWGTLTAKLRASYGRSTKPPPVGLTEAKLASQGCCGDHLIPIYGDYYQQLGNPNLGPENQQGGEGGAELYFGNRGSLVITRFNQTVNDLIINVYGVDSVRTLQPYPNCVVTFDCLRVDADGYGYLGMSQNLNVANIRNQGWEAQGTLNVGPFTTRGTYSWTKSRVIGVTERYRALMSGAYAPGSGIRTFPEHTWALDVRYGRGASSMEVTMNGTGQVPLAYDDLFYDHLDSGIRLSSERWLMNFPAAWLPYFSAPGYVIVDVNATHRFNRVVEAVLQIQNAGNTYRSDDDRNFAVLGRQTKMGVRLQY